MKRERKLHSVMTGFIVLCLLVTCKPYQQYQPARPTEVRGWVERKHSGVDSLAELLLSEGESSDNGSLGIKVVSITPEVKSVGIFDHPPQPEAVLRFYRVPDQELVQDVRVWMGGRIIDGSRISAEFGVSAIYVNQISTRDRWIWLDIRK
jgi:hypothetical protein